MILDELKLIAGGVGLLAVAGAIAWGFHDLRAQGAAGAIAAQEKQHAKDVDVARADEKRIQSQQFAAARESDKFRVQALADARDAAAAGDRLQHRFAAINAGCVPDHPAATARGPAASSPADLRADVLRGVVQAAERIASAADGSRAAGQQAVDSYPVKQ